MATDKEAMYDYMSKSRGLHSNSKKAFESNLDFTIALNSEVGVVLLKDLIDTHEELFRVVASLEATDGNKEAYIYINRMVTRWASRIAEYERNVRDFKDNQRK